MKDKLSTAPYKSSPALNTCIDWNSATATLKLKTYYFGLIRVVTRLNCATSVRPREIIRSITARLRSSRSASSRRKWSRSARICTGRRKCLIVGRGSTWTATRLTCGCSAASSMCLRLGSNTRFSTSRTWPSLTRSTSSMTQTRTWPSFRSASKT